MNDKHSFAGYVEYNGEQYYCMVNDYRVKFIYGHTGNQESNFIYDNEKEYLYGVDDTGRPFALLAEKGVLKKNVVSLPQTIAGTLQDSAFGLPVIASFFTPVVIRGKPVRIPHEALHNQQEERLIKTKLVKDDLSKLNRIDFVGETINRVSNLRMAVNQMDNGVNVRNIVFGGVNNEERKESDFSYALKSPDEYNRIYDVDIDGTAAKLISSYWHTSIGSNAGSIYAPIAINSAISLRFTESRSIKKLKKYYLAVYDFLCFLTGQQNIGFAIKLFNDDHFLGDCFFWNKDVEYYKGGFDNTIQIEELGDKLPNVFDMFAGGDRKVLRFLPENNRVISRVSHTILYTDVCELCTAFEVEFALYAGSLSKEEKATLKAIDMLTALRKHLKLSCETFRDSDNKDINPYRTDFLSKNSNKEQIEQYNYLFKNALGSISHMDLPIKHRIFLLYKRTLEDHDTVSEEQYDKMKEYIGVLVDFRNDKQHEDKINWGECEKVFRVLCRILYINLLLRAKLDKKDAIRLADKVWC